MSSGQRTLALGFCRIITLTFTLRAFSRIDLQLVHLSEEKLLIEPLATIPDPGGYQRPVKAK